MRKLMPLCALVVGALLVGCGGGDSTEDAAAPQETSEARGETPTYEDGFYFAQQESYSERTGWKYTVSIEVEDGAIVSASWNGAHETSGTDKVTRSESGEYGMVETGGAQSEWHVQAAAVEEYLIEVQDPAAIAYDENTGYTDAISGVSIHINEFVELAAKALENGPVGRGPYEDGHHQASAAEFDHGWKDRVDLTVISGYIVAAYWNPVNEEGKTKNELSEAGEYGMVANSDATEAWHIQADKIESALIETQDPAALASQLEDADAVSGVSIDVSAFLELAQEALEG